MSTRAELCFFTEQPAADLADNMDASTDACQMRADRMDHAVTDTCSGGEKRGSCCAGSGADPGGPGDLFLYPLQPAVKNIP